MTTTQELVLYVFAFSILGNMLGTGLFHLLVHYIEKWIGK